MQAPKKRYEIKLSFNILKPSKKKLKKAKEMIEELKQQLLDLRKTIYKRRQDDEPIDFSNIKLKHH